MTHKLPTLEGRKYKLARLCIFAGVSVALTSMCLIAWKDKAPGAHIASVVGDFANILMVSVAMFSSADAIITSVAKWKDGKQTKIEQTTSTTVTGAQPTEQAP